MDTFAAKIPYYTKVMWGILVLFAFIGVLFGKSDIAVPMAVIVAVMWVLLRIVYEALAAGVILWAFSVVKTEEHEDGKGDKGK